jgi:hypothetical protein
MKRNFYIIRPTKKECKEDNPKPVNVPKKAKRTIVIVKVKR